MKSKASSWSKWTVLTRQIRKKKNERQKLPISGVREVALLWILQGLIQAYYQWLHDRINNIDKIYKYFGKRELSSQEEVENLNSLTFWKERSK